MREVTVKELFGHAQASLAYEILLGYTYPWEVMDALAEHIRAIGKTLHNSDYERVGEDVWISRTASVSSSAVVMGPAIIGDGSEVRQSAFLRGGTLVGRGCVVGNSTELKNCILFDEVQVPHFNYVGDAILGFHAHLGAGAVTSNVKSDRTPISVRLGERVIQTGRKKLGAMLGDFVEIGCNSVLNPGTVIGRESTVYPLCSVRGYLPPRHILKGDGTVVKKLSLREE